MSHEIQAHGANNPLNQHKKNDFILNKQKH